MSNPTRLVVPPEHRAILARIGELMLHHALAEQAKKMPPEPTPEATTEVMTLVKLLSV